MAAYSLRNLSNPRPWAVHGSFDTALTCIKALNHTCNRREANQEGATTDVARLAKNAAAMSRGPESVVGARRLVDVRGQNSDGTFTSRHNPARGCHRDQVGHVNGCSRIASCAHADFVLPSSESTAHGDFWSRREYARREAAVAKQRGKYQ